MLKEINTLAETIIDSMKLADWIWQAFDKPGNERDFDLAEAKTERDKYETLVKAGVESCYWSMKKDLGGRSYTVLTIHFGKASDVAIKLLSMDMEGTLMPSDQATGNGIGSDEYVGTVDGEDVYVCPWDLEYDSSVGWLSLDVKVFRD